MNIPLKIAWRYFASRNPIQFFRKPNSINLLTLISLAAATIITMAAIVILSVLNGMMTLVGDLNSQFNPDVKVLPLTGKVISLEPTQLNAIKQLEGVGDVAEVLEEIALFEYADKQKIGVVKGVDENYNRVSNISSSLLRGKFDLKRDSMNYGIIGLGIANELSVNMKNPFEVLQIYVPRRKPRVSFAPAGLLGRTIVRPGGEFAIQKEYDDKYVFVPLDLLRPMLSYPTEVSYLEVKLAPGANTRSVQKEIKAILGDNVEVLDKFQQNKSWYKVMQFEKWATFGIIALIMLIASFNMLSSLTMIVLDKKKDVSILKSMGLGNRDIGKVFRWQGALIGLSGAVIGGGIAILLVLAQQRFGFVPMQGSFVVDAYPVTLKPLDVLLTMATIIGISWLAAYIPSKKAERQALEL